MTEHSVSMRGLRLLAAVLQLALPGAAACADGRLDAAAGQATAHIESHTTDSCARIHPPDCALCHFLTTPLAPRRPTTLRLAATGHRVARGVEPRGPEHAAYRPHPQPRAPPALS